MHRQARITGRRQGGNILSTTCQFICCPLAAKGLQHPKCGEILPTRVPRAPTCDAVLQPGVYLPLAAMAAPALVIPSSLIGVHTEGRIVEMIMAS
jgi:hypothetical protein